MMQAEDIERNLIYGLIDPRTEELRYVGQSSKGLERPKQHWSKRVQGGALRDHCHNWVRSLLAEKLVPEVVVLESYDAVDPTDGQTKSWLDTNERLAIAFYREMGCDLTNQTDGGGGSLGRKMSDGSKAKIKAARARQGNPRLGTGRKPLEKTCLVCGGTFLTKRAAAIYCSMPCYFADPVAREKRAVGGKHMIRSVVCVDDGELYRSAAAAALAYGTRGMYVTRVCRGEAMTAAGKSFRYASDVDVMTSLRDRGE